jgi:hypothetical protein
MFIWPGKERKKERAVVNIPSFQTQRWTQSVFVCLVPSVSRRLDNLARISHPARVTLNVVMHKVGWNGSDSSFSVMFPKHVAISQYRLIGPKLSFRLSSSSFLVFSSSRTSNVIWSEQSPL